MGISVLILAKNEEKHIVECIRSCTFADEVVVIDDESTDATAALAESLGARVIQRSMQGDWGAQQTYAITQAREEWIFFIDADERCTPELAEEIVHTVEGGEMATYEVRRVSRFAHVKATHGVLRPDYVPRLMPKAGSRVEGQVHPTIVTPYPVRRLRHSMIHYTYDNWSQYFQKLNRYADLSAVKYFEAGKPPRFFRDVVLRPHWAFCKAYWLDRGFLDGKVGFVLSVSHFFYTFQKYARLYYLHHTKGKF